jgi:hypothetical protein
MYHHPDAKREGLEVLSVDEEVQSVTSLTRVATLKQGTWQSWVLRHGEQW